jgi:transposase-like protein
MIKIMTVCKFCGKHDSEESTIEINFRDQKIYFVCPKCEKTNTIELKASLPPLPRIKGM